MIYVVIYADINFAAQCNIFYSVLCKKSTFCAKKTYLKRSQSWQNRIEFIQLVLVISVESNQCKYRHQFKLIDRRYFVYPSGSFRGLQGRDILANKVKAISSLNFDHAIRDYF